MKKQRFRLAKMKDPANFPISSIPVFPASQVVAANSGVDTAEISEIYDLSYLISQYAIKPFPKLSVAGMITLFLLLATVHTPTAG